MNTHFFGQSAAYCPKLFGWSSAKSFGQSVAECPRATEGVSVSPGRGSCRTDWDCVPPSDNPVWIVRGGSQSVRAGARAGLTGPCSTFGQSAADCPRGVPVSPGRGSRRASVQSSLLDLAQTEPPDSIAQFSDLATFLLKKVPALKAAHAQHRHESQAVTEEHPSNVLNKKEMNTLAVTVYIAELTLDANRYRDAKMKARTSVKHLEEKHRDDLQRHVTNVKQARDTLGEVDVRFASPPTGGIDKKRCTDKDVTGLAVAAE